MSRIDFDEVPRQQALPGCRFKQAVCGGRQLRLLAISRGFVEPHWCVRAHSGIVFEGEVEIDFQGRIERYPEGSGLFISGGSACAHKARAITEQALLFLVEDA